MAQENGIYQLIEISKPKDFDALSQLLDETYDPVSVTASHTMSAMRTCSTAVVIILAPSSS